MSIKGFNVHCPMCGVDEGLFVKLHDCETLHCENCDEEIEISDLRDRMAGWVRLLAWLDTAPSSDE